MISQKKVPALPPSVSFEGKTALVTGANRGLGFATCQQLVERNVSKLVLAVRTLSTGEEAKEALLSQASKQGHALEVIVKQLDMASEKSVIALVDSLSSEGIVLHLAILNAAISLMKWTTSPETQNEMQFQVNYLSTVLLSLLLLPLLQPLSPQERCQLCIVGSQGYQLTPWNKKKTPSSIFSIFKDKAQFDPATRYSSTKYFLFLFTRRLASQLPARYRHIQVYNTCPGFVKTTILDNLPWYYTKPLKMLLVFVGRKEVEGGRLLAFAASGELGDKANGEMVADMKVLPYVSSDPV